MTCLTIGMIGAGEMGAGLAHAFCDAGHHVLSDLEGRSRETLSRAAEAEVDHAPLADIVSRCQILFSVLPTQCASSEAGRVAHLIAQSGTSPVFVEANAVAPRVMTEIATLFAGSGAALVDGGLVGAPPTLSSRPRLYACGPDLALLGVLDGTGFDLMELPGEIGQASAFKMTYAAMTKGTNALLTHVMLGAEAHGFLDAFLAEVEASQRALAERACANIPRMPADAARWEDEMRQIALCFEDIELTGDFHRGAEAVMAMLAASPLGRETRRTRDRSRGLKATVQSVLPAQGDRRSLG